MKPWPPRWRPIFKCTVPDVSSPYEREQLMKAMSELGSTIMLPAERYDVEILAPRRFRSRFRKRH